jgi:phosphate transport system permease protein
MSVDSTTLAARSGRLSLRLWLGRLFAAAVLACTLVGILALGVLIYQVLDAGVTRVDLAFLTDLPSRFPQKAGFHPAIIGSIWVIGLTGFLTIPVGIGAAIYLELYAPDNWLTRIIQVNIANLAGVPSIIYGILGLALFVRFLDFGRSVAAGALTMSLLVLPIVIIASQEALRAVPTSLRDGALALGATRWQTIRGQILPVAFPGMMTGVILALSRAMGETAPLIMIGAFQYVPFTPGFGLHSLGSAFTVMPVQIYAWAARPQEDFQATAAAGIIVLLVVLLAMNSVAILLRNRYQRKVRW